MNIKLSILLLTGVINMNLTTNLPASELKAKPASIWRKVTDGLEFPEGPAWDDARYVYFSNCRGNWIGRTDGEGAEKFLVNVPGNSLFGKTNGLTFYRGYLFACDFGLPAILKISPEGKVETYADSCENQSFNKPNDLAFDKSGNLYFSDPAEYDRTRPDGRVIRIAADAKTIAVVQDKMAFPNGIAFSPDEKFLYIAESAFERVDRYKVNRRGELHDKQVFINLPGGDPDGLAFDVNGNLYVAHFGGGAVYVVNPQGVIIRKILTPGQKPSNLEFGGPDLKTLYLTEAETNALYCMPVEIAGLPLPK